MKKKNILFGVVAVAVLSGLWAWYDISTKPANERIQQGVKQIVGRESSLRPMYDAAMSDGVLTTSEAKQIIDQANKLKGR